MTRILRWLIPIHRYLGMGLGLMMVLWCLSGVVMMYVSYPALTEDRRLAGLEPLAFTGCCSITPGALDDAQAIEAFAIDMLAGRPVLRIVPRVEPARVIDLIGGHALDSVGRDQALAVGRAFAGGTTVNPTLEEIDYDQWTVAAVPASDRPLFRVALGDVAGTELYISRRTGVALQVTTARERFWNWLGAVPHWLYFAELRRNTRLWTQVVVCASFTGTLLTIFGILIGVAQFRHGANGRISPYRGLLYWHHVSGLVFGVFTFTWVASGLLSMNPWGLLDSDGGQSEREALQGAPVRGAEVKAALAALVRAPLSPEVVSVESSRLDGRLYLVAKTRWGSRARLDASATPAPLTLREAERIARTLGNDAAPAPELLAHEDAYYFGHHETVTLPIYRLILGDEGHTRYYIDPVSGSLVRKIDANAQRYRWLHQALHRLDFAPALLARPAWDATMLLLMTGVTLVCTTGAWLGLKWLGRLARQPD